MGLIGSEELIVGDNAIEMGDLEPLVKDVRELAQLLASRAAEFLVHQSPRPHC